MNILLAYVSKLSKPTEVMPPYETFLSNAAILDVILQNSTPSTACNENRLRPGGMTSHGLLRLASGMAFVFTGNARQLRRPCACWRFCCFFFFASEKWYLHFRETPICRFRDARMTPPLPDTETRYVSDRRRMQLETIVFQGWTTPLLLVCFGFSKSLVWRNEAVLFLERKKEDVILTKPQVECRLVLCVLVLCAQCRVYEERIAI